MVSLRTIEDRIKTIRERLTYDELCKMTDDTKFITLGEIDEDLSLIQDCIKYIKEGEFGNL